MSREALHNGEASKPMPSLDQAEAKYAAAMNAWLNGFTVQDSYVHDYTHLGAVVLNTTVSDKDTCRATIIAAVDDIRPGDAAKIAFAILAWLHRHDFIGSKKEAKEAVEIVGEELALCVVQQEAEDATNETPW